MRKKTFICGVGLASLATVVTSVVALVGSAGAGQQPFTAMPAVGNIGALRGPSSFVTPEPLTRLSTDERPASAQVIHAVGAAGFIWTREDGSVCTLMTNGPGGCFSTFIKPVVLYLWGDSDSAGNPTGPEHAAGVVSDSIRRVVLVTTAGDRIAAPIEDNGFAVEVPTGATIAGEEIAQTNGKSYFNADRLGPSRIVPEP